MARVTYMLKATDCSSFISKSINSVKVALRKKRALSKSSQKSNLDGEEHYQYTDADAPYTPKEIDERFWELWIF